jgi:hypothetical protein
VGVRVIIGLGIYLVYLVYIWVRFYGLGKISGLGSCIDVYCGTHCDCGLSYTL